MLDSLPSTGRTAVAAAFSPLSGVRYLTPHQVAAYLIAVGSNHVHGLQPVYSTHAGTINAASYLSNGNSIHSNDNSPPETGRLLKWIGAMQSLVRPL